MRKSFFFRLSLILAFPFSSLSAQEANNEDAKAPAAAAADTEAVTLHKRNRTNGIYTVKLFREVLKKSKPSHVVIYRGRRRISMATVIDKDGHAVTKASLLNEQEGEELVARTFSRKEFQFEVIGEDKDNDLALIKVLDADGELKPVVWAADIDKSSQYGHWVAAPNYKLNRMKVGLISAKRRVIDWETGYIGIAVGKQVKREGLKVTKVFPGSAGDKAGIKKDDWLLSMDNKPIDSRADLEKAMETKHADSEVRVVVERDGNTLELKFKILAAMDRNRAMSVATSKRRTGFSDCLQTDLPVEPEEAGGTLFTIKGEALGVIIARFDRVTTYALSAEVVQKISADLIKKSKRQRRR